MRFFHFHHHFGFHLGHGGHMDGALVAVLAFFFLIALMAVALGREKK